MRATVAWSPATSNTRSSTSLPHPRSRPGHLSTGEINEGQLIEERIDATMATTQIEIATATADAGYAYAKVYGAMERRGINAVIPAKADPMRSAVPLRRFKFNPRTDTVKCPQGKILT